MDEIESIRDKLNKLIIEKHSLMDGEIIKISQELDKLITSFYLTEKNESI